LGQRHLIDNLDYQNVYRREAMTGDTLMQGDTFGFRTTRETRPLLVERVQDAVNGHKVMIRSIKLHDQLCGFAKRKGRPTKVHSASNLGDDGVIAMALSTFGHDGLSSGLWRSWDKREDPRPKAQVERPAKLRVIFDDEEDDSFDDQRRAMHRT
jgi:hypothetical protein